MDKNMVGTKVTLTRAMLGNPKGVTGYVFAQYKDFDDAKKIGVQVIFPNGQYDGFSAQDQELYLEVGDVAEKYEGYRFTNVMQVGRDFVSGYWNFAPVLGEVGAK